MNPSHLHEIETPYDSPWTVRQRVRMLAWEFVWAVLCAWTPKPANRWRLFWLKVFGATIEGLPFVHQRARVQIPWNLTMHHRACLGDGACAYSLGKITVGEGATVAQEVYLCAGTHAFDRPSMDLVTAPIVIERDAFLGARAFVMPGITIGARAIVGACAVVTRNVAAGKIVAGNPAREIGQR